MAKASTPAIDKDRIYKVSLTKSVRVGRITVHPGGNVRLSGEALKRLQTDDPSAISGYEVA